jgi:hypothetical protein
MKALLFAFFSLLLLVSCFVYMNKEQSLKNVSYDTKFIFKDSLEYNFINQGALDGLIVNYKCTAKFDKDTLLIDYGSRGSFEHISFKFKIHKDSMKIDAIRKTCMGSYRYKTTYCKAVIDKSNFKIGDRISLHLEAQFFPPKFDSTSKDSTGIIRLKGCLWNLMVWDKEVTEEQEGIEYLENKRREFFVKAKNPEDIETLSLWGQFRDSIPKELVLFKNLKSLDLRANRVRPKDFERIASMENLEELYLDKSELTEVPLPILKLKKLRILSLTQNPISELPRELLQLTSLEVLHLGRNNFKEFPPVLKEMYHLKDLSFYGSNIPEKERESEIKKMDWLGSEENSHF